MKQLPPTWTICVFKWDGIPESLGFVHQIDMIGSDGSNAGSTNSETLRKMGYAVPDFSYLPHGKHVLGTLTQPAGHGASSQLVSTV